jgi:hypothetical protein
MQKTGDLKNIKKIKYVYPLHIGTKITELQTNAFIFCFSFTNKYLDFLLGNSLLIFFHWKKFFHVISYRPNNFRKIKVTEYKLCVRVSLQLFSPTFFILRRTERDMTENIQSVYKLSKYFAKPYFHKHWTEIYNVTTIWKRNVCSFIVTLNAFDVRPTCETADVQAILPFPPNTPTALCWWGSHFPPSLVYTFPRWQ